MSIAWLIVRRELSAYFRTTMGYIVAAGNLFFFGLMFNAFAMGTYGNREKLSAAVLTDFFYWSVGLVVFVAILLCMRLFSEERQTGTLVVLETAPIREWQIVIGKFLGAYLIVALVTLMTLYMPAMIHVKGHVSIGHVVAGYIGLLALVAPVVAIGTFASSLARNQVIAALLHMLFAVPLFMLYYMVPITEPPIQGLLSYLDLYWEHFGPTFSRGTIRVTDLVYYFSLTGVFLIATNKVLRTRRWVG